MAGVKDVSENKRGISIHLVNEEGVEKLLVWGNPATGLDEATAAYLRTTEGFKKLVNHPDVIIRDGSSPKPVVNTSDYLSKLVG